MVCGNARIDDAKMTGMTPPVLTLSGMCVLDPPYIRRPTTRLAYCTVTAPLAALHEHDGGDDQRHQDHQDEDAEQAQLARLHLIDGLQHAAREPDDDAARR